jgi:alpha-amylase
LHGVFSVCGPGDDYGPAPDLDHLNPDLRAALKDWLLWLQQDIGFGGWRLDFVKGYGARYVEEYISTTVGADVFNVGEYW